jgi:hypothetical protein
MSGPRTLPPRRSALQTVLVGVRRVRAVPLGRDVDLGRPAPPAVGAARAPRGSHDAPADCGDDAAAEEDQSRRTRIATTAPSTSIAALGRRVPRRLAPLLRGVGPSFTASPCTIEVARPVAGGAPRGPPDGPGSGRRMSLAPVAGLAATIGVWPAGGRSVPGAVVGSRSAGRFVTLADSLEASWGRPRRVHGQPRGKCPRISPWCGSWCETRSPDGPCCGQCDRCCGRSAWWRPLSSRTGIFSIRWLWVRVPRGPQAVDLGVSAARRSHRARTLV